MSLQPVPNTDLTTLADAKSYLSTGGVIVANADDDVIQRLITQLSTLMLRDMNRLTLISRNYTEQFRGHGQTTLVPRQDNVTAVVSVVLQGQAVPQSTDGIVPGWFLVDDGSTQRVMLVGRCADHGTFGSFTYTAGFSAVPLDVSFACLKLVGVKYRERKRLGMSMEALPNGGGTATYSQKDVPDDVRLVIEQYTLRF